MKKIIPVLLTLSILAGMLTGCADHVSKPSPTDSGKLKVVATLFPQYDFAREIAGDQAEVTLLLPPGMESHSYEPTPGDIITIHDCDVFLYTGDEMEPWVADIVGDIHQSSSNIKAAPWIANLSSGIALIQEEHDHEEHEEHSHKYNPHIWTSPVFAAKMVENVMQAFMEADPEHASYYEANGAAYLEKLQALDARFRSIVEEADFDTVYVGSKFSLLYFMEEYGLHYAAAYDSCEEEAEPSIKRVVSMIESMKESGVTAVYYQELIEPYIANTIAEATGGETYLFHSCHNVSKDDLTAGVTYLSLMEQNAVNLEKGLNK